MNEYRFRQCPKDGNIQCNKSQDRCDGCPIAKAAPAPAEEGKGLEPEEIKIRWERTR